MAKKKNLNTVRVLPNNGHSQTVPSENQRLAVNVATTLVDGLAGTATTEIIWGSEINKRYLGESLSDAKIREGVTKFLLSRQIGQVVTKLIPTHFFRPEETAYTKAEYFEAICSTVGDEKMAGAIMELTLPALLKIGIVSGVIDYTRSLEYGFKTVTVDLVKTNVMIAQAAAIAKDAKMPTAEGGRQSRSVFAEAVAEAFRPLGHALEGYSDLSTIVDDMVLGVRANLDFNLQLNKDHASIPLDWRRHAVVTELSSNLVFVREALALATDERTKLHNDLTRLEKYGPTILSALKTSDRFKWVSKEAALATLQIEKIRDIEGRPVGAVIGRNITVEPVGQAVMVVEDAAMTSAYSVAPTRDRIAEVVKNAYGKADFSLLEGATMLADSLREYVEAGWKQTTSVYCVDTFSGMTAEDVALLLADVLSVELDANGVVRQVAAVEAVDAHASGFQDEDGLSWHPLWWYTVNTNERSMKVKYGSHLGDRVITSSIEEVVIAAAERTAKLRVESRPQLISPEAFNTRLVQFTESRLMPVTKRFAFDVKIAGLALRGSFNATDFASMRSHDHTRVTRPFFNAEVINGLQDAYGACMELDKKVAATADTEWTGQRIDQGVARHIRRRYARKLIQLAQTLDPGFRSEVQNVMVEKSIHSQLLKGANADLYRAQMTQKSFMAYCDVVALLFFLHVQGIEEGSWEDIKVTTELAEACMEFGSDRKH